MAHQFSELTKAFDRKGFHCGEEALERYLQRQAQQDQKRRIAKVFVLHEAKSTQIIGFYTLSAVGIDVGALPPAMARKLPKHPIPAGLIGRLAVDQTCQGKGWGGVLLADALQRLVQANRSLAIYTALVDAKNPEAQAFYMKFGFIPFPSQPMRLFLPMATFGKL